MKFSTHRSLVIPARLILCVCFVSVLAMNARGQNATDGATPLALSPGSPSGSYPLSDFDTVNLYNGSLNFRLPLLAIGGRGGSGYQMTLHAEQKWTVYRHFEPGVGFFYYADGGWWSDTGDIWRIFSPGKVDIRSGHREQPAGNPVETLTRITVTMPDGTEYELRDQLTGGQPVSPQTGGFNRGRVFVTADGSAATFISDWDIRDDPWFGQGYVEMPDGYLMLKDGTRMRITDGAIVWMRDRTGNKTSFVYDAVRRLLSVSDSLNRQVTITYPSGTDGETEIRFKGYGGADRSIKIGQTSASNILRSDYTPQSIYQLFPELHGGGGQAPAVSYVELPNGKRYQFQYNPYNEVARVILPTGGAIEYDYAAGLTDGYASGTFSIGTKKFIYRRVIERRVYPDGGSGNAYASRMTYSRPETNTTNAGYVTTEQRNNAGSLLAKSQHYFYGSARTSFNQEATHYAGWRDGREYQTDAFASDGATILRRITNSFLQRAPVSWWGGNPDAAPPNDPRQTETTTTMEPAAANLVSKQTFGYDDSVPFNNQNNVKEYDFGSGLPGGLLRETRTIFVTSSNYTDASTGAHLRNLASQVSIFDGSGIERTRTVIEFDNYTPDAGYLHDVLVPRSNVSGFCDANTSSCPTERDFADQNYVLRGNATKTTQYFFDGGVNPIGSISSYSQYDVIGNVVKIIDPRSTPTAVIATTFSFSDRFGAPDGEARSNGGATELAGKTSFAFATQTTNAANHTSFAQFDYYLGRPVDGEDANGVVASGFYNDSLDRPRQIIRAANQDLSVKSQTTFAYDDNLRIVTTTSDQHTFGDNLLKTEIVYDGFGRAADKRQYETADGYVTLRQTYDALGRVSQASNPFRSGETVVWTTSVYDALGRVTSVTTPDNAVVGTAYSGDRVLVTDQAGKRRISKTNALGQLKDVWEVTAPDSGTESISFPNHPEVTAGYRTTYNYDTLDNLTQVTLGAQPPRLFVYDSLKRLTTATSPESGTVSYQYDNIGNLLVKTDARGVSAHYDYDVLGRVTRRWYNGSSSPAQILHNHPALPSEVGASDELKYFYDSQSLPGGAPTFDRGFSAGRLVASTYGGGSAGTYVGYDAAGKTLRSIQQTGAINYQVTAAYNLAGAITSMVYPSGRTTTNTFDGAGRLSSFTGNLGGTQRTYSSGIIYSAFGGQAKEQFGTDTPLFNKSFYNSRGQRAEIRVSTSYTGPTDTTWNRGAIINHYSYQCWGMCDGPNSTTPMTDNNGNLRKQDVYIPADDQVSSYVMRWQEYDYDSLNRLRWVREISGETEIWRQSYLYDRWGNRTINYDGTTPGIPRPQFDPNNFQATNRLYAPGDTALPMDQRQMRYDSAGNLTHDAYTGQGTREYDAENKMTRAWANGQWQTYVYDGDARRVKRSVNGTETWQVYGIGGELIAEYAQNASYLSPQKEYGYRNGELLITATVTTGSGGSPFSFADDPLVVGTTSVKAAHLNELRTAVNQARSHAGLPAASWAEGITAGVTTIKASHVTELRTRLDEARQALALSTGGYTDPALANGYDIRAAHISELRTKTNEALTTGGGSSLDIRWLVVDQLGTPRMLFDQSGSLASASRHDYLPFGEELFAGTNGRSPAQGYMASDGARQKFTSKERDNETGLDYFLARFYSSPQGRFTSTDPIYFQAMMSVDPQRFNLYAYARNNPLQFIDPTGEKLHIRGDALNVVYDAVGGRENFEKYFEVKDGQIVKKAGADLSDANAGVKFIGELVERGENFLFYAGTDAAQAASYFKGSLRGDANQRLRRSFNGGYIAGNSDRGHSPADLPDGQTVFAAIAINTANLFTQTTDLQENLAGGGTGTPFDMNVVGALIQGMGQKVQPVSLFIHEAAENLRFAQIGVKHRVLGYGTRRQFDNYGRAHNYAKQREAVIRKELNISGGFAGGYLRQ